jgi:hypothetical protein
MSCRSMGLAHAHVESLMTHASSPVPKISAVGQPVVGSGSCRLSLGLDGGDLRELGKGVKRKLSR